MELTDVLTARRSKKVAPPSGLRSVPVLSGRLPVVGHTVEFVRGTIELLARGNKELGEVAAIDVAGRTMVAMYGPAAHEAVFRAPDAHLSPMEAYKIMTPVFGKGIVYDAAPERMAEQLKMLLPALQDRRMRTYGEAVVFETEDTVRPWGKSGVVDFVELCRTLTSFTSSRCLLGKEFREGMSEEFARVYHDLEGGVTPLAYIDAHLPIPSFKKRDKARVRMVEMISEIVRDRKNKGRTGEDFLQTLMDATYADGTKLTDDEITGLLLAAIFAGHHTSSVTTAWTLIELLQNPAMLQRAIDEVDRVFEGGKPVTHASLRELNYIECCIKEALRLHPPLFMLVRVAMKDFVFKDWFIPAGTWILVSPTVSHRLPDVFPEPDAFEPERFLPPRSEDKKDFAYIAFGGGRHKCLGNAFAILQIKAILALLLGQFDFGLCGDAVASDFRGLVIGPKEPCRVRYRRRAQPSVSMTMGVEMAAIANDQAAAHGNGGAHDPAVVKAAAAAGCPAHAHAPAASAASDVAPKKIRIRVDRDLCQGHGVCAGEAPEVFAVGKDQKVMLKMARPPAELYGKVRLAAEHCPTRTIRLEEESD